MRAVLAIAFAAAIGFSVWMFGGQGGLVIEDVRAVPQGEGAFTVTMTIRNAGSPDHLLSAASNRAEVSIVSKDTTALPIPGESTVSLSSDGAMLAVKDLTGSQEEGAFIPLTLTFEAAGDVAVKALIAKSMQMAGHGMTMKMGQSYDVPDGEPDPRLSLTAAPDPDGGWQITLNTENFTFSKDLVDGPHVAATGHAHFYVGGVKLGRLYEGKGRVPPLPSGMHIARVTLNTNDHRTYSVDGKPVTATVKIAMDP